MGWQSEPIDALNPTSSVHFNNSISTENGVHLYMLNKTDNSEPEKHSGISHPAAFRSKIPGSHLLIHSLLSVLCATEHVCIE